MEIRRCLKCMHELKPGQTVCPECGHVYGSWATDPIALKPGTILDGKYLVGEMLGQGGFGITYIGFDLLLEQKVAIKEYFPMSTGLVSRDNCTNVVWNSTRMEKAGVQKGFDSFLKEARKMAKLGGIPNVVGVKSVFIQNETAYIVMDFIEGETLLKKLQREGPMEFDTCISLLKPIMQALAKVHQHGIIHRDISPDNIMVQKDGTLILLDLGAAKDLDIQKADGTVQSSQLVAKQGFSPVEQYGRSEKIGPWTDVYAMAATIYYCCTGKLPPSATDRVVEDTLSCQPLLTKAQFDALSTCMTILPEKRPRNMEAMLEIIDHTAEPKIPEPIKPEPTKPEPPKNEPQKSEPPTPNLPKEPQPPEHKPTLLHWLMPFVAVGLVVLGIAIGTGTRLNTDAGKIATALMGEAMEVHVMAAAEDPSEIGYDFEGEQFFWGQSKYKRKSVETITFQGSLKDVPSNAWDVSEAGDQSILAWMDGRNLYVASDGKIAPNYNASYMFAFFINLKEVKLGNCFDTANVIDMSWMFYRCSSLTKLDLTDFDTRNVANMRCMFSMCSSLTGLDLSGFHTADVTNMRSMFYKCSSLTSLNISGFDTTHVTDMDGMFSRCSSLTSLNISGFDTTNVTDMGGMFYGCSSLTDLKCSDSKILTQYTKR